MAYYNDYHRPNYGHRVNEEDVPESKHAVFIRGLPGSMTTDDVKEFFEDKIGPCSFDFTKVSQDRARLFVAVRFETRDDAKECMSRYRDSDIMGYRCELSWFKDIRRFANYQAAQQGRKNDAVGQRQNRVVNNNRAYSGSRDNISVKRKRKRSRSRESSAQRSTSRSRSRTGTPPSRSRSRSRSSSRDSRESHRESARRAVSSSPSSSPERGKKRTKKDKKKKKDRKRSKRSVSSESSASEAEVTKRESPVSTHSRSVSKSPRNNNLEDILPPPTPQQNTTSNGGDPGKITIQLNASTTPLQKTAISFELDGDESPKRIVRPVQPTPVVNNDKEPSLETSDLPPPPLPPTIDDKPDVKPKFRPIADPEPLTAKLRAASPLPAPVPVIKKREPKVEEHSPVREASRSPSPPPIKKQKQKPKPAAQSPVSQPKSTSHNSVSDNASVLVKKAKVPAVPAKKRHISSMKFPLTTKVFGDLQQFQKTLLASVKAPKPKEDDEDGVGLSLSLMNDETYDLHKEREREAVLASLDEEQFGLVQLRKNVFEKKFKNDAETFAFVVRKLLEKNPAIETGARTALMEVVDDLQKQMLDKIDHYLNTVTGAE